METAPQHGYGVPGYPVPIRSGKTRANVFASVVLGLTFNASMVSVVGSKIGFFSSSVGNAIAAGALLILVLISWSRSKKFSFVSLPFDLKLTVTVLCTVTFLIGVYGFASPDVDSGSKKTILLKMIGVLVSISALASSSCYFNFKEISLGLLVFAFVELFGCVLLFVAASDVNANTIAVRATVACMCIFLLLPSQRLGWAVAVGCIVFSALLGCRTSSLAFIGALTFLYVEKNSRRQRGVVVFLCLAGFTCVLLLLPFILAALQQLALGYLGSENPIARFFLHDKSSEKISYDFLDRFGVWTYAWEFIREKPLLGYGLGTEKDIMRIRCHNAYLSLMFEGGVVLLAAWVWFYARSLMSFFDRRWLRAVGESKLFYLATTLLGYMLLAGIVESSGLSSVSTPINLIFIFLTFWLFQPNRDPYNRTFTGA